MNFVFDLDGCLIDSRAAVIEAYQQAGIIMPQDAWGKPWQDWCPRRIHDKKIELYPTVLKKFGFVGPALRTLDKLITLKRNAIVTKQVQHGLWILTSASREATILALNILRITNNVDVLGCSYSVVEKRSALLALEEPGLYFDDDAKALTQITDNTPWVPVLVASERDADNKEALWTP
jgi:beta-phosphoglucomutase-like phosphatase (HAD superfamily)